MSAVSVPPVRRQAQTLTTPTPTSYPQDAHMVACASPTFPMTGWHTVGWEVGAACECNKQPTTATSLEVRLFLLWNLLPASSNQPSAETAAAWIEQLSEIKTASSLEMEQDVTSSAWEDFETVISEVDVTSTVAFLAATYI